MGGCPQEPQGDRWIWSVCSRRQWRAQARLPAPGLSTASNDQGHPTSAGNHPNFHPGTGAAAARHRGLSGTFAGCVRAGRGGDDQLVGQWDWPWLSAGDRDWPFDVAREWHDHDRSSAGRLRGSALSWTNALVGGQTMLYDHRLEGTRIGPPTGDHLPCW